MLRNCSRVLAYAGLESDPISSSDPPGEKYLAAVIRIRRMDIFSLRNRSALFRSPVTNRSMSSWIRRHRRCYPGQVILRICR